MDKKISDIISNIAYTSIFVLIIITYVTIIYYLSKFVDRYINVTGFIDGYIPIPYASTIIISIIIGVVILFILRLRFSSSEDLNAYEDLDASYPGLRAKIVLASDYTQIYLSASKISKIVSAEFNNLPNGQITYVVSKIMKVGIQNTVLAIISSNLSEIKEKVENCCLPIGIKISPLMTVTLTGDNFSIISVNSSNTQAVINGQHTTWTWNVTPQKSGTHKLFLNVDVLIKIPDYPDNVFPVKTLEETIEVEVNHKNFLEQNWKWIVGTMITIASIIITAILAIVFKK